MSPMRLIGPMGLLLTTAMAMAAPDMNSLAESYVRLALAAGVHDADYVDAYYGPPEWRAAAEAEKLPLPEVRSWLTALRANRGSRRARRRSSNRERWAMATLTRRLERSR